MADAETHASGRVTRVIGPVVDVEFPPSELPEINTALTLDVELGGETSTITCEVAQHIGDATVRAIALKPTDGVVRGSRVHDTGGPITVPVGEGVLGHVYNVLGDPLDTDASNIDADTRWPIHRDPPPSPSSNPRRSCSRPASR